MSAALMEQTTPVLARALDGDPDSFAALLTPLLDPAYRLAAVLLSDRAAAEDAVQEASMKAWRKIHQLHGDAGTLRPWFLAIIANECRMSRRTRWWSVLKFADLASPPTEPAAGDTDLHRALLRLSPRERLPLILHFYLDLPLDEVARTLHSSPAAAKSRIYRAAKRLRADLRLDEVI